jgi:hypothetical protein
MRPSDFNRADALMIIRRCFSVRDRGLSEYRGYCGTSMSGMTVLLIDHYFAVHGSNPGAMLLNSTSDVG